MIFPDTPRRTVLMALPVFIICLWIGKAAEPPHEWRMGGQNLSNTRHQSAERMLSPSNVRRLRPRWIFRTGGDVSATAAIAEGAVYVPDWRGNLFKIEATTGKLVWERRIDGYVPIVSALSRTTPVADGSSLYLGLHNRAYTLAVETATGDLIWKSQLDTHPAATITQSPVVFQNRMYVGVSSDEELFTLIEGYRCCTFRGSVAALDIHTGSIVWKTYMTLDNHGMPGGFSGAAVWGSTPVVDSARNTLYITTGNNYDVPQAVKDCQRARNADPSLPSCAVPGNYIDAVVALDLHTGAVKWSVTIDYDAFTFACATLFRPSMNCPDPQGNDWDFGQGPMLFSIHQDGKREELLGVAQKSGIFWALDPDTGAIRWRTQVGPGGHLGGSMWGSATDGRRIYVGITNSEEKPHLLENSRLISGGFWSALDPATGRILWQTPVPASASAMGPVTVANGVLYGGSLARFGDNMFALDAATGAILWHYASGGSVAAGASVANGTVYWGSGYSSKLLGSANNKLYAFDLGQ